MVNGNYGQKIWKLDVLRKIIFSKCNSSATLTKVKSIYPIFLHVDKRHGDCCYKTKRLHLSAVWVPNSLLPICGFPIVTNSLPSIFFKKDGLLAACRILAKSQFSNSSPSQFCTKDDYLPRAAESRGKQTLQALVAVLPPVV